MKERIEAVQAVHHINKFIVKVFRQLDRFHVPICYTYSMYYDDKRIHKFVERFILLNTLLQHRLLEERIKERKR